MFFAAKRAGVFECDLRIQRLVSGPVAYDAPVIKDPEIGTFKHLVLIRTDKYEFHEQVTFCPYPFPMSRGLKTRLMRICP